MDELLSQIEAAHANNLFYLSLFASLALPDICGALNSADGEAKAARYQDWYNRYVIPRYDVLSAAEAYLYRCSALHQGKAEPQSPEDYERIIFIENPQISMNIKRATAGGRTSISVDLKQLLPAIIAGVREFCAEKDETEPFKTNMAGFMRRYPDRLLPWTKGCPTIA